MKARAAMIIAHQIAREIKAGIRSIKSWSACLVEAWAIVKTGKTVVVVNVINKAGREVKSWAKKHGAMNDKTFKGISAAIKKAGGKALGYEVIETAKPKADIKNIYVNGLCPHCETYCYGECKA